jgi:hypothetical protein
VEEEEEEEVQTAAVWMAQGSSKCTGVDHDGG